MIRSTAFAGRRVAVFGLGASGISAAASLAAGGAEVAAWDDSAAGRDAAKAAGVPLVDLSAADWSDFAALVLAPGVPLTHPAPHWTVARARSAGIPVIGDIELFALERARHAPLAPFIAITGTNGKSTTTALIAHLLASLGHDVQLGGNIGRPILTLEPPAPDRFHVVEMSSFQIDLTPTLRPTVGVLLNVTPDHIDRHGTLDNYASVKERLVDGAEAAAIGVDDAVTRAVALRLASGGGLYAFAAGKSPAIVPRFFSVGSTLIGHKREGGAVTSREIASLDGVRSLRGQHNVQNALAAITALRALQDRIDHQARDSRPVVWAPESLQAAFASFPGLPHRLEQVAHSGRVIFINDSKATNADSAEKALASWPGDIFWIAGGRPKEGGIESLEPLLARVAQAFLIGEAADEFAATLERADVVYEISGTLEAATRAAARAAAASPGAEPVVLLSPACASYDQFKNFEERGNAFRDIVRRLVGADTGGGARS